MNYGKKAPRTSIKVYFSKFLQNQENSKPEWSRRGAPGRPGGPLARPHSWPRQEPSSVPWTPPPTPPRLETFLLLQKFLLYICPDSPNTVSRDFVCFLFRSVSAREKAVDWQCLLVTRVEKITWAVVYDNSNKTTIKISTSDGTQKKRLLSEKRRWSA